MTGTTHENVISIPEQKTLRHWFLEAFRTNYVRPDWVDVGIAIPNRHWSIADKGVDYDENDHDWCSYVPHRVEVDL